MPKTRTKSVMKKIESYNGNSADVGETYSVKDKHGKLVRDITPITIQPGQIALLVASGPVEHGDLQSIVILENDTRYTQNQLVTRNSREKLELTSLAKKLVNEKQTHNQWRVLRKEMSSKMVLEGVGKTAHFLKTGKVLGRSEPLSLTTKKVRKKLPKKKTKTSGKTNGQAQSERASNGKKFQMYGDRTIVLPMLKGTNFDYIHEPNAGGDFAFRAEAYNPHYYEVQRNGHENYFEEVQDTDGGVVSKFTPSIPLINFSMKVLIKEVASNLVKDAKNNAELGIYTFLFLSKAEGFGWHKGKTTKPRKHLRMVKNLGKQLGEMGKGHLVEVFIDDDTGLDERTFSEYGMRRLSEAPGIIKATLARCENDLKRIVAPRPNEGLNENAIRIIQSLDCKYAERTQKLEEVEDEYSKQDLDWIRPETSITFQQALRLMDAYKDGTISSIS
jgi:hypothetical protein